jgi:hypothetical protein
MAQHIFERPDILKSLRSLKTSQQSRYKLLKKQFGYQMKKMKIDPNKKKLSKKEIEMIKEKIKAKMIRERIYRNILTSVRYKI